MVNPPPIRALTAITKAGVTYQRRPEVQAEITALLALTTNELIARLTVSNEKDIVGLIYGPIRRCGIWTPSRRAASSCAKLQAA